MNEDNTELGGVMLYCPNRTTLVIALLLTLPIGRGIGTDLAWRLWPEAMRES